MNTEVVDQISGYNTTISANEGFKLFVVTLIGIVTEPCQIIIGAEEFSVIYEEETTRYSKYEIFKFMQDLDFLLMKTNL